MAWVTGSKGPSGEEARADNDVIEGMGRRWIYILYNQDTGETQDILSCRGCGE